MASLFDNFLVLSLLDVDESGNILGVFTINPALIVSILALLVLVVLFFYLRRNTTSAPLTSFLYANARIQSRIGSLVDDKKIDELANTKSVSDIVNHLRETEYIDELEKLPDKNNLRAFHNAVEKSFLGSVVELKEMNPKAAKIVFDAYLMLLEAKVLKTIFRARIGNEDVKESLVFPIGNINSVMLKHLIDSKTVADMGVVLSTTIYSKLFEEEYENAEQFDIAIEGFVLSNLIDIVEKNRMYDAKFIIDIIRTKMDILNLLALIKFKIRDLPADDKLELLIPNKTLLGNMLEELVVIDDLKKLVESCKGLDFGDDLTNALESYEKDGSMMHFEQNLIKYFKNFVVEQDIAHTLGPYPLFSYLIKKEIEVRNLFIISSGIDCGFSADRIKGMVA